MSNLTLKSILKEAWEKVSGSKKAFFCLFLIIAVVQLFFLTTENLAEAYSHHGAAFNFLFIVLTALVCSPIIAGFYMFGVKRARGEVIHFKQGLAYFKKIPNLFFGQLLISFTLWVVMFVVTFTSFEFLTLADFHHGFFVFVLALLVLIGLLIFLSLVALLSFTFILIAHQNLSFWKAYKTSVKKAFPNLKVLLAAEIVFILVHIVALIPLGIGLLWSIPFSYIATGIFYREIFKK